MAVRRRYADADVVWEVETDDGWAPVHLPFDIDAMGVDGCRYERGKFRYKATIGASGECMQENLETGKKRRLRRLVVVGGASPPPSSPTRHPRRSGSEFQWRESFETMRDAMLTSTALSSAIAEPLARAEAAAETGAWEVAFNQLFVAQEAAQSSQSSRTPRVSAAANFASTPSVAGTVVAPQVPSSVVEGRRLKRSASVLLGSIIGESRVVSRRLLDDVGGDEGAAIERAWIIRDLEEEDGGQLEMNKQVADCAICCESGLGRREALRFRPCCHGWYCVPCIRRTVDMRLAEGATLGAIGCPECQFAFSERLLKVLLTATQMERLHRQGLEHAVATCAELRPCPTPDCANRVALEDGAEPRLRCELCRKEHCLLCSASPYHAGRSCEEYVASVKDGAEVASLKRWMAEVGAKQCPKCKMVVTKVNLKKQGTQTEECHKMICRNCRTKFCFGCLAELTETFTCGCTKNAHGFLDPVSGEFVPHLTQRRR